MTKIYFDINCITVFLDKDKSLHIRRITPPRESAITLMNQSL